MATKKFLIIEPEKEFALSLAAVLNEGGAEHRFAFVEKGKDAVDEAVEFRPDLIILRAELPDQSGFGLVGRLRKPKKLRKVPILLLSSDSPEAVVDEHRRGKTPADGYLAMPFDMEEFRRVVTGLSGVEIMPPREDGEAEDEPADVGALRDVDESELSLAQDDGAPLEQEPTLVSAPPEGGEAGASGPALVTSPGHDEAIDEALDGLTQPRADPDDAARQARRAEDATLPDTDLAPPADGISTEGEVETVSDDLIMGTVEEGDPGAPRPPDLPRRKLVSEKDLAFVDQAFESIREARQRLHEEDREGKARPAGKKGQSKGGMEEKLDFLREKLKQREMEIARLADIWESKEREFSAFNEKLLDKEVDIQGFKMRVEDLERKLEEAHRDGEQQAREFKASVDSLLEEKVTTENDLIQVVAEKEKQINDMRVHLAQRDRERDAHEKELLGRIRAGEEQYALLGERLATTVQNAAQTEQQLHELISAHELSISSLEDQNRGLRHELDQLGDDKAHMERDLKERLAELEQRGADLERDLQTVSEEKSRSEAILNEGLSAQMERANRLESELHQLQELRQEQARAFEGKIEERDERVLGLEDSLRQLQKEKEEQQQRLAAKLDDRESKIASLESELGSLRQTKESQEQRLNERLLEREQKIENLERDFQDIRQRLAVTKDDLEQQLRARQDAIRDLEQELVLTRKDRDLSQREGERFQRELGERVAEHEVAVQELKQARAQREEELGSQIAELEQYLEEVRRERTAALEAADRELADRDRQLQELRAELAESLAERDQRIQELRQELAGVREERNAALEKIDQVTRESEARLEDEIRQQAQAQSAWSAERLELERQRAGLEEGLRGLQAELDAERGVRERLEEGVTQLEQRISSQAEQHAHALAGLVAEREERDGRIRALDERLSEIETEYARHRQASAERTDELELLVAERDQRLAALAAEAAESRRAGTEALESFQREAAERMQHTRAELSAQLQEISGQAEAQRLELEHQLHEREARINGLEERLQAERQDAQRLQADLTESLAEAQGSLADLGQRLAQATELERDLRDELAAGRTREGELGDQLAAASQRIEGLRGDMRERIEQWEGKIASLHEQLALAEERETENRRLAEAEADSLRVQLQEQLAEADTRHQERLRSLEQELEQALGRAEQLQRDKVEIAEGLEAQAQELVLSRQASETADRAAERARDLARQFEETMNLAIREKEELELRAMQEVEAKQDHYIKELERVRSSHIAEMTRLNQNFLQRGKALKIAELEIQRLKDKVAELEKRPLAMGSSRATGRVLPAAPMASGEPVPEGGGDFDIDQMLDGLKDK
jgi:chromosome segregation ATPase